MDCPRLFTLKAHTAKNPMLDDELFFVAAPSADIALSIAQDAYKNVSWTIKEEHELVPSTRFMFFTGKLNEITKSLC